MKKALIIPVIIAIAASCGKEVVTKEVLVEAEAKLSVSCSTGSTSEITPTSATVAGVAAIVNAKDTRAAVCFYYSTESPSGDGTLTSGTKADAGYLDKDGGSFEFALGGLSPETIYYYAAAVSVDGQEFFGKVESFVTEATPSELVTTGSATDVSVSGATISGFANLPAGIGDAVLGIVCSKDKDNFDGGVILATDGMDDNCEYKVTVSSLSSNTEYYYQAFVRYSDVGGPVSRYGETHSFKTKAVDAVVQTLDTKDVSEHNATLCGRLSLYVNEDLPTSASFHIGKGSLPLEDLLNSGKAYPAPVSAAGNIELDVKDLESGQEYSCAVLVQVYDESFYGEVKTFTTSDITTVKTTGVRRIQHSLATVSGLLFVDGNKQVSKKVGFLYSSSYASADGLKANGITAEAVLDGETFVGQLTGLEYGNIYYYLAYAEVNGRIVYADEVQELTPEPVPAGSVYLGIVCKDAGGMLYDLFWGTKNIGAEKPEDYGDYYAWGETEVKTKYATFENYKWCNGSITTLTKYNNNGANGIVDNITTLEPDDDVAHVKLGGKWRLPTYSEWNEFITQCTLEWTTYNGVNGIKATGSNGDSVFLPAAGDYNITSPPSDVGTDGHYWSSSLYTNNYPGCAHELRFNTNAFRMSYNYRPFGESVRPVTE